MLCFFFLKKFEASNDDQVKSMCVDEVTKFLYDSHHVALVKDMLLASDLKFVFPIEFGGDDGQTYETSNL
jgi:hypothetical protein